MNAYDKSLRTFVGISGNAVEATATYFLQTGAGVLHTAGHLSHMNSVKIFMTLLSMSSCSSVDRVPAQRLGGHEFDSCQRLRFFFVPC